MYDKLISTKQPFYTKLPFHYHRVPGNLRKLFARVLYKTDESFSPDQMVDYSPEKILRHYSKIRFIKPKLPKGKKYTLCLTHDVDTNKGYKEMSKVVSLEKKYNFRSTFFLPSHHYSVDFAYLKKLESENFEIGIHGYDHSGKLPFLPEKEIRDRLRKG